ncbi:hypothetical protein DKM44_09595 [Deinococcus irradiatisoli]|uniref:Nudix hydrolase domain-containing protein n=1 Tax=Deinococcus irradiatisoli TaxID=2202254 RepID=A0A2Z3JE50_9DEIO|nr:NUDIX domain-containing protein [Deinococcus irradiatisoli]AWN23447.1 hypothetical protein DKM44_09595 [Deinococcus irradiatisoli]
MSGRDLDFQLDAFRFSLRAAVIVIRGGLLLVCREPGLNLCYLPGGRIQAGEDSMSAARRELLEETGQDVGPLQLALIAEEFFQSGSGPHQGIGFYYVALSPPRLPDHAFANRSAEGHWFEWVRLERLEEAGLVPPMLQEAVLSMPTDRLRHLISRR